jgi:hypothetical protein
MKFGAKKNPTVLKVAHSNTYSRGVTFRAKFHSKSLYSVEKRFWESRSTPTLADALLSVYRQITFKNFLCTQFTL